MKKASVLSNSIFRYSIIGILVGSLFSLCGMFVSVWLLQKPITLSSLLEAQSTQPLLWIIDAAPLVLGITFGMIGKLEARLMRANAQLESAVEERTSELLRANQEILKNSDDRKKIESDIIRVEKEWESTFDVISDLIFLTDDQDKIVRCNRSAAASLHKSNNDLIGQSLTAILFPDGSAAGNVEIQGKEDIEFSCLNGHFSLSSYSILMDSTSPRNLTILHNIHARKRAEIEMLRQKQYFEALVVNNPAAIVVLDIDRKIQSCNPAFEKLYGYTSEEVLGKEIDSLITTQEMAEEAKRYTEQAEVGPVQGLGERCRKDGSLVDVEILAVPVRVGDEKIGTLAIYHDISELLHARREAETANQAKSEFLANMSHEIRTPMTGVIGMIELSLNTDLSDEQRDYLQVALQSAETLLILLNDILDYSKIEAKKLDFETIDFNLRTTVEDMAFSLAPRAQTKGLEMACLIHPDLQGDLRGDPARLRQVLINLVNNAIKFTHQGEIVICAESISDENDHAVIKFSVQDTGIGIPQDRQEAIFNRFTQADGSTTRHYGGTGLGLTICEQLVDGMGGEIQLDSTPGVGSTFSFSLQFEKQLVSHAEKKLPLPIESVKLEGMRILLVDDNSTNRLVLTHMVENFHCRIETAPSGAIGLEMLLQAYHAGDPYQIVLLDMQMPGMDGEQTARFMLETSAGKQASIIILTSMGQRGDANRLETLGCSGYLLKPIKQHVLYDALIAVTGRKNGKGEPVRLITRHTISEARRQGFRILMAEDNPVNQKLTATILQKAGFSVDVVDNGLQAFEKVKTGVYQVVLMDVQMPMMDGLEATRQIRADPEITQHIPIIAMTAHAFSEDRERCMNAGMDDYVSKPIDIDALLKTLDRWTVDKLHETPQGERKESYATQDYSVAPEEFQFNDLSSVLTVGLFGETPSTPSQAPAGESIPPFIEEPLEPPMDVPSALPRFNHEQAFFMEMCQDLIRNMPDRVKELRSSFEKKDAANFSLAAHNLKGISANFSAIKVNKIASEMEKMGQKDDLSTAGSLLEQLDIEIKRLFEYMITLGVTPPEE